MATSDVHCEPARDIPVVGQYDVIVCGGGTAGFPAAIEAARRGAKVALIERYGFLGGVPAYCIMPAWHRMAAMRLEPLERFAQRVAGLGRGPDATQDRHMEPEFVKQAALETVLEAGVELHLHSLIVDTIRQGDSVVGVVTESKSGRRAYRARVLIDATGDGDVCARAGAEFMKGRQPDGLLQGMTVRFRVGYIDFERYFDWVAQNRRFYKHVNDNALAELRQRAAEGRDFYMGGDLNDLYEQIDTAGELPRGSYFNCSSIRPGELSINATRINGVDGTVEEDLTRAEVVCRRQAHAIYRFLCRNVPGFEQARLIETAPQVGVRETRCVRGDYVLTEADCRQGRRFDDAVFADKVVFDMHEPKYVCESANAMVDVPYRCLLPAKLENILVVGRCISTDHWANSSLRQMATAFRLGMVGGIAAAMSVRAGVTCRALAYADLRPQLLAAQLLS